MEHDHDPNLTYNALSGLTLYAYSLYLLFLWFDAFHIIHRAAQKLKGACGATNIDVCCYHVYTGACQLIYYIFYVCFYHACWLFVFVFDCLPCINSINILFIFPFLQKTKTKQKQNKNKTKQKTKQRKQKEKRKNCFYLYLFVFIWWVSLWAKMYMYMLYLLFGFLYIAYRLFWKRKNLAIFICHVSIEIGYLYVPYLYWNWLSLSAILFSK